MSCHCLVFMMGVLASRDPPSLSAENGAFFVQLWIPKFIPLTLLRGLRMRLAIAKRLTNIRPPIGGGTKDGGPSSEIGIILSFVLSDPIGQS